MKQGTLILALAICTTGVIQPCMPDEGRDVAPIIAQHCSGCHQPGGIAPFSLVTAEDLKKRAKQIGLVTQSGFMPPWLASENGEGYRFHGRRGLNDSEMQIINDWVQLGGPEMPLIEAPGVEEWPLGAPDMILNLNEPYTIPAAGEDVMRTFVFPVRLDEDQFIKAIDFNPGNPRVVHHAAFLIDDTGHARMLDDGDPGAGYQSMADIGFNLAGSRGVWSPAPRHRREAELPEGVAWPLPNQCEFVAEVHFRLSGKPETIQPRIGIYLAKESVKRFPIPIALGASVIDIPADENNHVIRDTFTMPVSGRLLSIAPRAHYVCKRITAMAHRPQEEDQPIQLLRIDDWDFNWQQQFTFEAVGGVFLAEGTRIDVEFVYDNSATNPRNPNHPPKRVRDGWKSTDEMGMMFLYIVPEERAGHEVLDAARNDLLLKRFQDAKARRRLLK